MLTMGVVLLACGGVSGVVASVGIFVAYIITRDEYLLDLEIHGTLGVIAALLVALAFREPKAPLLGGPTGGGGQPWPMTRLGAPLILLTLSAAARACGVREGGVDFPFAVVGAYFTWGYLRFFHGMLIGPSRPVGDVREELQLIMFFPPFFRRFLKPLCDFSYGVFLLLGFFQDRAARVPVPVVDSEGGLAALPVTLPLPEARDPVAQRRRARAMKLLDEKFAKLSANSTQSKWEDEGGGLGDEHLPPARSRTPPPGLTVATAPASALPAGANSSSAAMASDAAKGSSLASSGDLRIGAQKNPCLLGDDDNEDWGEQDT
ncbi:unnamed protein product [Discosporangium mesarthrocarpum]